jgi:hypothetical protein
MEIMLITLAFKKGLMLNAAYGYAEENQWERALWQIYGKKAVTTCLAKLVTP